MLRKIITVTALLLAGVPAFGQALEVRDGSPLVFESLSIRAAQDEGVALVDVDQTFRNTTDIVRQGTYTFRLPENAVVHSLSMWMEGKEKHGQVLEARAARQIYDSIVRARRDPALLEEIGHRTFRVSVFPIPARDTVRIRLVYAHVVDDDLGLRDLEIPLPEGVTVGVTEVRIAIQDQAGTSVVDCPSHEDARVTYGEGGVTVAWSAEGRRAQPAFRVRSAPTGTGVGLAMLTHRDADSDTGTFLVRIVPQVDDAPAVPRDVVFVIDRSGSMQGQKIEQARAALLHGLGTLQPRDRFAIVAFASGVGLPLGSDLCQATAGKVADARRAAASLDAAGGTNIEAALRAALGLLHETPGRMSVVVFLTDGDPTVGETNPDRIVARYRAEGGTHARLFAFGVGVGVKDFLLSRLAKGGRGAAEYVRENEDLEVKLSALFDRVQSPVMTDVALSFEGATQGGTTSSGVSVLGIEPEVPPDVFRGTPVVLAGRYKGHGLATLRLTGRIGGTLRETVVPVAFPESDERRPHVTQLWARSRIDRLLEELRVHGDVAEIRDEITSLGVRYQVVSPYTSFLVVEDGVHVPDAREQERVPQSGNGPRTGGGSRPGTGTAVHSFGSRGPAGEVPPDAREPSDPPPPPSGGGPTTPGGETGGPTTGGGDMGGPTTGGGGLAPKTKAPVKNRDYAWWRKWWEVHRTSARYGGTRTAPPLSGDARLDATEALRAVALDDNENFFVRSEAQRALARLGGDDDATRELADRMRRDGGEFHRVSALRALRLPVDAGTLDEATRVHLLMTAAAPARARNAFDASFAALTLGLRATPGDADVLETLLRLASDPDAHASRPSALLALGLLGDRAVVPELVDALDTGRLGAVPLDDVSRVYLVDALGRLGDESAFDPIRGALLAKTTSVVVRRAAPAALARLAVAHPSLAADAVRALDRAVSNDKDVTVVAQARLALGWMVGSGALPAASRKTSTALLSKWWQRDDGRDYVILAMALAHRGGALAGFEAFLAEAQASQDVDVSVAALEAERLAGLRSPTPVTNGASALDATDATSVARDVAYRLGATGDASAARELIAMVRDDRRMHSDLARGLAARALGQMAGRADPRDRVLDLFPYRAYSAPLWEFLDLD